MFSAFFSLFRSEHTAQHCTWQSYSVYQLISDFHRKSRHQRLTSDHIRGTLGTSTREVGWVDIDIKYPISTILRKHINIQYRLFPSHTRLDTNRLVVYVFVFTSDSRSSSLWWTCCEMKFYVMLHVRPQHVSSTCGRTALTKTGYWLHGFNQSCKQISESSVLCFG